MGVRDPSVASVSRCQPVTFKRPDATETDVAPSRAATRLLALPPPLAQVVGRSPRGAGRGGGRMVWDLEGQVRATHCASGISRAGGVWGPVGNPVGVAAARVYAQSLMFEP